MLPSDSSSSSSASRALTSSGRAMPSRLRSAMLAADAPALPASSLFAGGGLLSGRRSNLEEPHRGGGGGRAGAGGRAAVAAGRRAGIFSSASSASSVSSAPPQSPQRLVSLLSVSSATPQCLVSLLSASSASSARPRPWRRPRARLSPRASPSRGLRPRTAGSGSRARPRSRPQGSLAAPRPPCPGGSERRCARTGQQGGARGEAGARGRATAARARGGRGLQRLLRERAGGTVLCLAWGPSQTQGLEDSREGERGEKESVLKYSLVYLLKLQMFWILED